jgi:long-subunit fatty acid transport protein
MVNILLSLLLVSDISPDVGTTGFNFLKVAPTAREAGMGNAAIGLSDNVFSLWYNPAGITRLTNQQVGLSYISYVAGVQSGALSFVSPMKDKALGIGGYYLNSGTMKRTDELGTELGTFSASYLDVNGAFGWRLMDKLSVGVGLKVLYGKIDTFWTLGAGGDLAVSYTLTNGLQGTFVARNLGTSVKAFQIQNERLPTELALGFGYEPATWLKLALDLRKPFDNNLNAAAGVEGWITQNVCLRAGLTTAGGDLKAGGGSDILAGVSAGLGVKLKRYALDYSFTPMVVLSNTHRISFRYSFQ